jgi:hypothetical protein
MIMYCKCEERECKHYKGIKEVDMPEGVETLCVHVCEAFPEEIPEDILLGDNLHDKPIDGDNGIQFEAND